MIIDGFGIQQLNVSVDGITHLNDGPKSPYSIQHPSVALDPSELYLYVRGMTWDRSKTLSMKYYVQNSVWHLLPPRDTERSNQWDYSSVFMLRNTLYSVGGTNRLGGRLAKSSSSMECLDVRSSGSIWAKCEPSFPHGIDSASACTMKGWVWLTGGCHERSLLLNTTYRWQPGRDQWQKMAHMNEKRHGHSLVSDGMSLYAVGGYTTCATNDRQVKDTVELYNASTNTWHMLARLPEARAMSGVVLLPWGQLLLAGGITKHKW